MHLSITYFLLLQVKLFILPGGVKPKRREREQIKVSKRAKLFSAQLPFLGLFFTYVIASIHQNFYRDVSEASFLASRPDQGNLKKTCSGLFLLKSTCT